VSTARKPDDASVWPDVAFVGWGIALLVFFTLRATLSGPDDEVGAFGLRAALLVGGPSKLLAFILATTFCFRSAQAIGEDAPTRIHWTVLGSGFLAFGIAQAVLVAHQLLIPGETPYPNLADACFVVGYGLMIGAMIGFARAYLGSGLLLVPGRSLAATALVAAAAVALVVVPVELSILRGTDPWLERVVGGVYPLLDACLIVLAALMIRITVALRGSVFARPWVLLLAGFVTFTLGDAIYGLPQPAWVTDPILDTFFALGYLLCAWGSLAQDRLLRA